MTHSMTQACGRRAWHLSLERQSDMGGLTGGDDGTSSPYWVLESRDELGIFPALVSPRGARLIYPTGCSDAASVDSLSSELSSSDQHKDVLELYLETACSSCVDYMRGYRGYKGACHMQAERSDCFDGVQRSPGA